jgi:DNA-binding transcriptional LysR family regulator
MSRLEEMEAFVRVVDAGSITAAADRMAMAKSAVSRRLTELEQRLGVQLLRRTTRTLRLTDTGRGFYERCLRILADVEEAESAVGQEHGTVRGRLRVALPLSFGLLHLGPAIADFMCRHPQVEFDLDFNDRQVDLLAEGFDVALRIADLQDSSLIARRLAPIHALVCASPDYLESHGPPRTPVELRNADCLVYTNIQEPARWSFRAPDGGAGSVEVRPHMQANNGDFLRQAAIAGRGVLLSPTFIVYRDIEEGKLAPVLEDYSWSAPSAYAVYPQTRHLSRRVRVFVDYLVERFAGVPYWDAGPAIAAALPPPSRTAS